MLPTIYLNRQQIGVKTYNYVTFRFNRVLYPIFQQNDFFHWDAREKSWVFDEKELSLDRFTQEFKDKAHIEFIEKPLASVEYKKSRLRPCHFLEPLNELQRQEIDRFIHYLQSKRYSLNTITVYSESLSIFMRFYSTKSMGDITNEDLITFNNDYILKNQFSASFQNQIVNAVKLYFATIQQKKLNVELIHRPRREKLLPNVLSKEEVKMILNASTNVKHRAMLSLIYACGLRRSELLNIRLQDVHSERNLLVIKQSKGKKDRIIPISIKIIDMLRTYYKIFKPKKWLFEGQFEGTKYSEKSLENVLKQSIGKAKILKPVSLHWLRHSYATHLLESGTDLRYIQELLGHASSRTTEIYTHVSTSSIQQIKSPFDDL